MRYDDDRRFDEEDDKDFWDDELELSSDDSVPAYSSHDDHYDQYNQYDYDDIAENKDNVENADNVDNAENDDNVDSDDNADNDYYSDPEPVVKSGRRRLFGKEPEDDENEEDGNDYYDSDDEPEPPKKTKVPKLDPEDPDYWIEEDESPLSGIISGPTRKWKWQLATVLTCLVLILGVWIWFFRPYSDNAVKYGYIIDMERRGSLFKTFEGTMIPYKQIGDPDPLYFQPQRFSVQTDSLAAVMKRMMLGCVPVRVEYETYHATLPWKGEEKMVVIKADTAEVSKILPPEYRVNNK